MEEQKSKIEALESQLEELKQHRLQSDNENKLLKQENKVLKLKNDMDVKKQVTTKEASNQQLEEVISKMEANWVSSSATKNSESDENPENDICYD
jgi:regulator of replication initiation timing